MIICGFPGTGKSTMAEFSRWVDLESTPFKKNWLLYMADVVGESKKVLCISGMGQSKKAKAERKEALRQLNCGDLDVVFGTYQLAKEGLDVPNLKYVVLATPEKDETTVIQSVGRVGRKAEGKRRKYDRT